LLNLLFRLILGAILVCTKFNNDLYYSNLDFSIVSGISNAEMNLIERFLLDLIDY
jgi:hypothetical protein